MKSQKNDKIRKLTLNKTVIRMLDTADLSAAVGGTILGSGRICPRQLNDTLNC